MSTIYRQTNCWRLKFGIEEGGGGGKEGGRDGGRERGGREGEGRIPNKTEHTASLVCSWILALIIGHLPTVEVLF